MASMQTRQDLWDAFHIAGKFAPGSLTGLIKHPKELDQEYQDRCSLAAFPPFLSFEIRSNTVRPIFRNQPIRTTEDALVQQWLTMVDGLRADPVDMDTKMPRILTYAMLFGSNFIVMENHPAESIAGLTRSELGQNKKLPYIFTVSPLNMPENGLVLNAAGEIQRFCWVDVKVDSSGSVKKVLKMYTAESLTVYWFDGTEVPKDLSKLTKAEIDVPNQLQMVPVFPLVTVDDDLRSALPESPYNYALQVLKLIYNYTSWIAQNCMATAFPIFYGPAGMMSATPVDETTGQRSLEIGSSRGLAIPEEARHAPGFAAPPSAPNEIMQEERAKLVELLLLYYNITWWGGTGANQSGEAKKQDRWIRYQNMEFLANRCEAAERWMVSMLGKYLGTEFDYDVQYDTNYADDDSPDYMLDIALDALSDAIGLAPEVKGTIRKKVIRAIMSEEPRKLQKELEEAQDVYNDLLAKMPSNPNEDLTGDNG